MRTRHCGIDFTRNVHSRALIQLIEACGSEAASRTGRKVFVMASVIAGRATEILNRLGVGEVVDGACAGEWIRCSGPELESVSPIDESVLGRVRTTGLSEYEEVVVQ